MPSNERKRPTTCPDGFVDVYPFHLNAVLVAMFGVTIGQVKGWAVRRGLRKDPASLRRLMGQRRTGNKNCAGRKVSAETRTKISLANTRRPGWTTQRFQHIKHGYRDDIPGHWMRSSWDANIYRWCRWLTEQGVIEKFGYEVTKVPYRVMRKPGTRHYIPDFTILSIDGVTAHWEVKGYFSDADKRKMRYVMDQHPELNIALMTQEYYRLVEREYSHLVPNWEHTGGHPQLRLD